MSVSMKAQAVPLGMSADHPRPETQELTTEKTMPEENNSEDLELAASIVVALALEEKKQTPRLNMAVVKTTASSWRIAGRLELMKSLKRDD